MGSGSKQGIRYACVARHADGLIAASYESGAMAENVRALPLLVQLWEVGKLFPTSSVSSRMSPACVYGKWLWHPQTLSTVRKVLESGNLKRHTKCTVTVNDVIGTLHLSTTELAVYVVVTPQPFRRRTAFECLTALRDRVTSAISEESLLSNESLTHERGKQSSVAHILSDVAHRFNQPETDKAEQVGAQVEDVRTTMEGNINKMLQNAEDLGQVQDKAENMEQGARQFKKQSANLKSQLWWRNFKIKVIIAVAVLSLLAYILVRHGFLWFQHRLCSHSAFAQPFRET